MATTQVYMTTNDENSKYYIGIHTGDVITDGYYGSGNLLKNSIKKNGTNRFSQHIISKFHDVDLALWFEKCLVGQDVVNDDLSYNITIGGGKPPIRDISGENNPMKSLKQRKRMRYNNPVKSKTVREKISNSLKGKIPWNKGRSLTNEHIQRIKDSRNKKPVIQFTKDGKILGEYDSCEDAYNSTGIYHIGRAAKGERQTAGGFKWKYKKNIKNNNKGN